jgi:hypothetical protein
MTVLIVFVYKITCKMDYAIRARSPVTNLSDTTAFKSERRVSTRLEKKVNIGQQITELSA